MKTIKKDPKWPEWAKYYARDHAWESSNGLAYVYEFPPYVCESTNRWAPRWGKALLVDQPEKRCRNWRSSLRKIEDVKFTRDELASMRHALNHLKSNQIDSTPPFSGGWYTGKRETFIKRHIKAKALLMQILGDWK
jgi:hypothetical protein